MSAGGAHRPIGWARAARRRRRRWLTPRGRITVVIVLASVVSGFAVGSAGWRLGRQGGPSSPAPASAAALPNVAARPAPDRTHSFFDPPVSRERFEAARAQAASIDPSAAPRLVEWRHPAEGGLAEDSAGGRVRVEYSLDEALTERVFEILRRGRVARGHAIVLDPRSGRLLSYVSTDERVLPADGAYPAASIVKVLTAAALLELESDSGSTKCVYRGNRYRLSRRRLDPPSSGRRATLETALASSNNQCFGQWALHALGEARLLEVFRRFGWLERPAPGHAVGRVEPVRTRLDLARLGSGLDGVRVNSLHVAQLAAILTHGRWIEPWWVDRVIDARGRSLALPRPAASRSVLEPARAERLRSMMVRTTTRGTARSAFRDRRGRARVGPVEVAGKTGNLSGRDPDGRYEWFLGLAPAGRPTIAVVVLQLQGHLWWRRSTELGADVLRSVFCDRKGCSAERADRFTGDLGDWRMPLLASEPGRSRDVAHSD